MNAMAHEPAAPDLFARARKIADAVLYEGYVLYPYRASATKNHVRWQFGVLAPRNWSEAGGCEEWWMQTECLLQAELASRLVGKVRFLQIRQRQIEAAVDGRAQAFRSVATLEVEERLWTAWQEGLEREIDIDVSLLELLEDTARPFSFAAGREIEEIRDSAGGLAGRVVREQQALVGVVRLSVEIVDPSRPLLKLRLRVENRTTAADAQAAREEALPQFLVGVHALLAVPGGAFLSLAGPPAWACEAAASCANQRAWPVLVGGAEKSDVVLASPIILDDDPQIAPESPGDLCDATEIDEILLLRTMTLTDDEKREARATDARAAAIIERADTLPPEILERLHGTIRALRAATETAAPADPPWWNPAADESVCPDTDSIEVRGVTVAKGSRVRLCPGARRSDAQDMFLADRIALVEGVFLDVDDRHYLAVTIEDDPAADLHQAHGRFLYFSPDEVEPLEESG